MPRQRAFIVIGLCVLLLGACTSTARTPAPSATNVSLPASPFDGDWSGTGDSTSGRLITIAFTVQAGAITSFTYTYPGLNGLACTGIDHQQIPPQAQPKVVNSGFSNSFGDDLTASGSFSSDRAGSGHVSIQWKGRMNCSATLDANWTGVKSPPRAQAAAVAPVSVAWCGKNVNCRDLLLQLLIFGLVNGAILALNAIGVTVIYSTVRILNLAHGDVFALTTALVTSVINIIGLNLNWPASSRVLILGGMLLAAILAGAILSVGVEALAFRPFRGRSKLAPLIASLGLSFILYQAALVWRTYQKSFIRGEHRSVPGLPEVPTDGIPNFLPHGNLLAGRVVLQASDLFVWVAAILFVLVATYILLRTRLGRTIRAVAQNEVLAQIVGVNRDGAIRRAFALGGALAGAAAFVFALYYSRPFGSDGAESGLIAFAAALLGGIGSPGGALVSGLMLGVVGSFSDYFLSTQWTPVLLLGLLTVVLVWRRGGFAGEQVMEDLSARDSVVLTMPGQNAGARRWLIGLILALALLPVVTTLMHWNGQILLRGLGIFILLTLGLNILLGVAGVLDLGYAMSFALGGYTAAILTSRGSMDFLWVVLASAALAGVFGVLKGAAALRLRGDYLAVATLTLGLMTQQVIVNGGSLTGGAQGLSTLPPPRILGVVLGNASAQYYLVLLIVLAASFASGRLIASRTGRAWLASSEDETAAASLGVNSSGYRRLAFVLSSVLAGIAGALYASTFSYIDPDIAAFHISAMMLAMVILGGAGSTVGAILGTALIYGYDKLIIPALAALLALLWPQGVYIGMVPDIRGTNFFDFGIALYLTVLWRARSRNPAPVEAPDATGGSMKLEPQVRGSPDP
ncbi:MAG TPA: ABC transporter permease [Anaerolineales bacterium]